MARLLLCRISLALVCVSTGCRDGAESRWPECGRPTEHIGQQLMVAGLFGIPPDHVTLSEACAVGGDRHWKVQLPAEMYPGEYPRAFRTFAITDDGVPVYVDHRPIPDDAEVRERWPNRAPAAYSVPVEQREFAERACYTVGAMLVLPELSEEYLSVVVLYPTGTQQTPTPRAYRARLEMNNEPWSQLGAVEMTIGRDPPYADGIGFGAPQRR